MKMVILVTTNACQGKMSGLNLVFDDTDMNVFLKKSWDIIKTDAFGFAGSFASSGAIEFLVENTVNVEVALANGIFGGICSSYDAANP